VSTTIEDVNAVPPGVAFLASGDLALVKAKTIPAALQIVAAAGGVLRGDATAIAAANGALGAAFTGVGAPQLGVARVKGILP
jgi:hypothetical protein